MLCPRATVASGVSVSAMIDLFSSADQTRRVLAVTMCGGVVLRPDMVPVQSQRDHPYPASHLTRTRRLCPSTYLEAKRGFVPLPRRWVVERSFAWAARFRRLARDYERLPTPLAGLHLVAFATLMLAKAVTLVDSVRNTL